jgi:antitoxin FitA
MAQVVIRNIDDGVIERLKLRAAAQHKSLEQCLREVLAESARPNRAELLAQLMRLRGEIASHDTRGPYPTAEELIREDRESH